MISAGQELDSVRQQAVNRAAVRLREQNALLVSEYTDLKAQIQAAVARLNAEDRRISRAGIILHPEKEGLAYTAQLQLLENARKQLEIYAKEHSSLRRKLLQRCTLDAVIAREDSKQDLETRLRAVAEANKALRRQQRQLDREEKQVVEPWQEVEQWERQVEVYLRKIRDLELRVQGNVDRLKESQERLERTERAFQAVDELKRAVTETNATAQSKTELEEAKIRLGKLDIEKTASENRLKARISELETTLKSLQTQSELLRRQNLAREDVSSRQESKLQGVKLAEIKALREIKDRHRGKAKTPTPREALSSSPLLRKASNRALTPIP